MNREQFVAELNRQPVIVTDNLPALSLVPDLEVVFDLSRFHRLLDLGELDPAQKYAIVNGNAALKRRFPVCNPGFDPYGREFSDALFDRFDLCKRLFLTQEHIAEQVLAHNDKDVVVLVVVDGLSYKDCRSYAEVRPCLVPGVTKTREGYRRIVGQPTAGRRLEREGFRELVGFTYWDREDDLTITNQIFVPFSPAQMHKVNTFQQILDHLSAHPMQKTYVQIVLQGLDYLCHGAGDEPLIAQHVDRVFHRLASLGDLIKRRGRSGAIFMTADHGVLWKHEHNLQKKVDPAWTVSDGTRYLRGKFPRTWLRHDSFDGSHYSLLKYPYIFRNLGPTEWGVHGGISFEESLVPFYAQEV